MDGDGDRNGRPTADEVKQCIDDLCDAHLLPRPDEVLDRADGDDEVLLLWHEQKLAVIVELPPRRRKSR